MKMLRLALWFTTSLCVFVEKGFAESYDLLPSWNDGKAKSSIIEFVQSVSRPDSPKFVPESERIATFDNDGTLWAEQPMYFQLFFAMERVRALAPQHPEWKSKEPFASLLRGDVKSALGGGERAVVQLVMETHAGMTTDEFEALVASWISTAIHPTTKRPINKMVYQPMLELMAYLRANDFKTFIVSGGGVEFMRPWVEEVYGIPAEQVIGSSVKVQYEIKSGTPVLRRLPSVSFINDKQGKPIGIHTHIGRRPLAAFGNSDGDLDMLRWTTSGKRPGFALFVHHTDEKREWSYDRSSPVGCLDKGLDEAREKGWTVVDMKQDWKVVYPEYP